MQKADVDAKAASVASSEHRLQQESELLKAERARLEAQSSTLQQQSLDLQNSRCVAILRRSLSHMIVHMHTHLLEHP